jgi:hypothetical protein
MEANDDIDLSTYTETGLSDLENTRARDLLSGFCAEIAGINAEIADLEARKKELMEDVTDLAHRHKLKRVAGDGWTLSYNAGRRYLSEERLLEHVTAKVIQECKVPGKGSYSVRRNKGKD